MNTAAQSQTLLAGRILLGLLFLVSGIRKVMYYAGIIGYFTKLGFPVPEVMVWLAIAFEIGGGILLIVGWQTRWAAWLLLAFVVVATAMAHRFWEYDAAQYANQLNHLLKNVAIIGGLLYVAVTGSGALGMDKGGGAGTA
jgi:putative oxidoreductase